MFFYEGMTCKVCQRPLKPDEDIVACPHCGLPHHRRCWQQEGHCHLEELHNTDNQWSRDQAEHDAVVTDTNKSVPTVHCRQCGAENPEFAEYCKRCGRQIRQDDWHSATSKAHRYSPFSSHEATVNSDTDMIDDISTADYAAVVGPKAEYYIPRFRRIEENNGGNWNWCAFLLAPYWLLYRKMYVGGVLVLLLQAVSTFVSAFVQTRLEITTYEQLYTAFLNPMESQQKLFYLLSMWILSVILLAVHCIIGYAGNRIYKNHCSSVILRTRQITPDVTPSELATNNGVSFGVALIGYFVSSFLSQIILLFVA